MVEVEIGKVELVRSWKSNKLILWKVENSKVEVVISWKCKSWKSQVENVKLKLQKLPHHAPNHGGGGTCFPRPRDYALEGGQNGVGVLLLCKNCILQGNVGKISKNPLKQNLLIFPTLLKNVGKISKIRPQNNCKIWKLCKNVVKISKICNYYMWLHNLLIFPTYFSKKCR